MYMFGEEEAVVLQQRPQQSDNQTLPTPTYHRSIIYQLQKADIFTKADLRSAYNIIKIKGGHWYLIHTSYDKIKYIEMPFGLLWSCFSRLINNVFANILDEYMMMYLADIFVYS